MKFLSAEQVVQIHAELLERWGGASGGGHRGADYQGVEAAVQAVKNSYYESAQELAASYAVYIVQGHVFMDVNERTGAAAMLTFLHANGVSARLGSKRLANLMIELQVRAENGVGTDSLIAWLASQLTGRRKARPKR
jgi:death-on-curing family protein